MKQVIIGVLFFGAIGLLVWKGVVEGGIPILKIQDLKASPPEGVVRVEGSLIHSIESMAPKLEFTTRSETSQGVTLVVEATCGAPDNFKVGNKVSIRGTFDAKTGMFKADQVQTACPSRYEASKEAGEAKPATTTSTAPAPAAAPLAAKEK